MSGTLPDPMQIYFNERLFDLCMGLPYIIASSTRAAKYRMKIVNNMNNNITEKVLVLGEPGIDAL